MVSPAFLTTVGTPQGDGLSPILFAVYLESALREVRRQAYPLRPASEVKAKMPCEAIYADDCDFISNSQQWLEHLESTIPPTIATFQLVANDKKWERNTIAADSDEPRSSTDQSAGAWASAGSERVEKHLQARITSRGRGGHTKTTTASYSAVQGTRQALATLAPGASCDPPSTVQGTSTSSTNIQCRHVGDHSPSSLKARRIPPQTAERSAWRTLAETHVQC